MRNILFVTVLEVWVVPKLAVELRSRETGRPTEQVPQVRDANST
jgi:hypothetical protein